LKYPFCISLPNFVVIGRRVLEMQQVFDFSNIAVVRHLGFVGRVFEPPLGGFYHCAKYG